MIDQLRRRVILAVLENERLDSGIATETKAVIEGVLADYRIRLIDQMTEDERRVFTRGIKTIDSALTAEGIRFALPYLAETVLEQARVFNGDLISGLLDDARAKINTELQLAVLGQKPATEVIKAIGKNLTSKSIFSTIADRAETIYLTEMARMQSLAAAKRLAQVAPQVKGLEKQWNHSHIGIPRPNHLDMDGTQVPAGEDFTLIGADGTVYRVAGPHDPALPAGEVISCRCYLSPVVKNNA